MQRWIALATVMFVLLGAGGWYFRHDYNMKRPDRIWCPIPVDKLEEGDRKKLADQLGRQLHDPARLAAIVKDLQLTSKFNVASEQAAVADLAGRVFVELGTADSPLGTKVPSLNIGVNGTRRENALLREISARQMDDVWPLLGMKAPPKKAF